MASPGKKHFLIRISPDLYEALDRWAADDLRSVNAQIEWILNDAVRRAGRQVRPKRKG
jgi:hypothetical protein